MCCIRLSRSIFAAASTTVTAYWVHMSQKWPLNHAAKCIHVQLVEPIRVIHFVSEQRTGECNVIDIHLCNRLVHIEKNLKLQMPLWYPFEGQCYATKQRPVLKNSNTILLTACSSHCWIRTKLVVWLAWISFGVILLFGRLQKTAS